MIDLGTIASGFRPGQPKPTADNPIPSRPGPRVTEKACGCGVLDGEQCDCEAFAAQWEAELARPIRIDFRRAA